MQQGWVEDAADVIKQWIRLAYRSNMTPSDWAEPVVELVRKSSRRADEFLAFLRSLG